MANKHNTYEEQSKINMLLKSATLMMTNLKIDPQDLIPSQFKTLFELANLNDNTTNIANNFAKSLETGVNDWLQSFIVNIDPLSKEIQKKAYEIFDETLLKSVNQITTNLYEGIKKGEGLLFNTMLSTNVVDAMGGILSFKKQIDESFLGLSDNILAAASMAITGIVCAYAPAAGVILKSTGILDKAKDFLNTKNLETIIDKLNSGIAEIEKDKVLAKLLETGIKLSDLTVQTDIPPNKLQKIGLNPETIKMISSELIKTPSAKEFIAKISSYSAEIFPYNNEAIEKALSMVKETLFKDLKKHDVSPQVIKMIEKEIGNRFEKAAETMKVSFDLKVSFFDKIAAQLNAARMIFDLTKEIKEHLGQTTNKNEIFKTISSKIQETVKNVIQSDKIAELSTEIKKLPITAQKSLKDALGSNFTNQIAIERSTEKLEKGGRER